MSKLLNGAKHWKKICKRGHKLTEEIRDSENHCIPCRRLRANRRSRFSLYGIDVHQYNIMREKQNYCCAICGANEATFSTSLCIDHNHKTGQVRGLLCKKCNGVLVMYLETQPHLFYKAKAYLTRYNQSHLKDTPNDPITAQ